MLTSSFTPSIKPCIAAKAKGEQGTRGHKLRAEGLCWGRAQVMHQEQAHPCSAEFLGRVFGLSCSNPLQRASLLWDVAEILSLCGCPVLGAVWKWGRQMFCASCHHHHPPEPQVDGRWPLSSSKRGNCTMGETKPHRRCAPCWWPLSHSSHRRVTPAQGEHN